MIKLGWMTDDSARRVEELTEWADWEYDMCLLNIYTFHRGHPQQTHSANLKKCAAAKLGCLHLAGRCFFLASPWLLLGGHYWG